MIMPSDTLYVYPDILQLLFFVYDYVELEIKRKNRKKGEYILTCILFFWRNLGMHTGTLLYCSSKIIKFIVTD